VAEWRDPRGVARATRGSFCLAAIVMIINPVWAAQDDLAAKTSFDEPTLHFDWPAIEIGVGSYEEGPTGLTIVRFPNKATAAVDVRGGGPGTVNTDVLRLGYGSRFVDGIVFSGGSSYGEEAFAAVMTGLKDEGVRSGNWMDVAFVAGAVIYDFQGHRLNEIYPDKRLAEAALHDMRTGVFPLGAQGAGRMAMQGGFFWCGAHSGQGGAFRQIGDTKIAAFVVVNASGAIVDRDGNLVKCAPRVSLQSTRIADFLAPVGSVLPSIADPDRPTKNTTVSLIVTNRKMAPWALQRMAVEVHTSMARAIQPFSTFEDGDTLFAVSTQELENTGAAPTTLQLDVVAGETMWDAILASVPAEPSFVPPMKPVVPREQLAALVGNYRFGPHTTIVIKAEDGKLTARLVGSDFFDLPGGSEITLLPISETEFYIDSRYHTRLSFTIGPDGKATAAIVNPGRWAQHAVRVPD
jgi:L-aminopeptidase/D-esterase-like protein